jgi:hypothetical protein
MFDAENLRELIFDIWIGLSRAAFFDGSGCEVAAETIDQTSKNRPLRKIR